MGYPLNAKGWFALANLGPLLEEGDGMTLSLIWVCHFLCFFSCSLWPFVHRPRSCRASWVGMWNYDTPHKSFPLLNRKNGSTGGVLHPCHFVAGGRRRRSQQTHDGQEGENHHRTHADGERLYQWPGSLHQGSDSAPEKQAGECGGRRMRQWCQGLNSATFCLRTISMQAQELAQEWRGAGSGSGASAPGSGVSGLWWGEWKIRYGPDHLCCTCVKTASRYLSRGQLGYYIPAYGLR